MESNEQLSFRQKIFLGTINALKSNMVDFVSVDLSGFTEIDTGNIYISLNLFNSQILRI